MTMSNQFPKGYNTGLDWGDWESGTTMWTPDPEEKPLTNKCTCGTNIAMGYEAPLEFHSDWCKLNEKM